MHGKWSSVLTELLVWLMVWSHSFTLFEWDFQNTFCLDKHSVLTLCSIADGGEDAPGVLGVVLLDADHEPAAVSVEQDGPCGALCRTYLLQLTRTKTMQVKPVFQRIVTLHHKVPRCCALHLLAVTLRGHTDTFPTPFPLPPWSWGLVTETDGSYTHGGGTIRHQAL